MEKFGDYYVPRVLTNEDSPEYKRAERCREVEKSGGCDGLASCSGCIFSGRVPIAFYKAWAKQQRTEKHIIATVRNGIIESHIYFEKKTDMDSGEIYEIDYGLRIIIGDAKDVDSAFDIVKSQYKDAGYTVIRVR